LKAIFPGTFDPLTKGHVDLVNRACNLFPKVVLAIADNKNKTPLFDIKHRVELAKDVLQQYKQVEVISFTELLVEFAAKQKSSVILRGLRAVSDFEYELQLANMNRRLNNKIETVFLTPSEQYSFVSSSLVKEIASLNGDVSEFVSEPIVKALKEKFR
jgi:pantetheine-phosphate adenylyltransferase